MGRSTSTVAAAEVALSELAGNVRASVMPLARVLRGMSGDLTPTQVSVIGAIHRHEPISLGELAAKERLSPAMISRVVATLADAGLVDRIDDPDDRRVCLVQMSEEGNRWREEGRGRLDAWLGERLGRLEAAELEALRAALPVLERLTADDG